MTFDSVKATLDSGA